MVRKVELDLMEVAGPAQPEESPAEETVKRKRFRELWKRVATKKIMIAAAAVIFSGIVGISLLIFSTGEKTGLENSTALPEIGVARNNIENLEGFIVDINDEHGGYRVLVCDLAVEMAPNKSLSENRLLMRKKTYEALKNKGRYILKSASGYSVIKKEMKDELDRILGGGVKEVYFTKFVLL